MLVYVHVPFCARRCSYCDFAIAVRRTTPSAAFAEAVRAEWLLRQDAPGWDEAPSVETIYFGGGTPSRLDPDALAAILSEIRERREVTPGAEVTLEANPDDVTPARAASWVALGITRVSLGGQSFQPAALDWMHRTHQAGQTVAAAGILRSAGLVNLNLDLIYGLPESLARDWRRDVELALAVEPAHVSFYALTTEAGTPLGKWTARGEVTAAPEQRVAEEFLLASELLRQAGFEHYEVSNAARPGCRAIHNAGYWARRPYLGLGPSAHSGAAAWRSWNVRDWEAYRTAMTAGQDPTAGAEHLTAEQVGLEDRYLGLRTDRGVPARWLPDADRRRWTEAGWGVEGGGWYRLTPAGWLRLDGLVARLSGDP